MPNNTSGTLITAPIRPQGELDTFPVAYSHEIKGGFKTVSTIAERDAIPIERRTENMFCYSKENDTIYKLVDGVQNINWAPAFDFQPDTFILGTKEVDETNLQDLRVLYYDELSGNLEYANVSDILDMVNDSLLIGSFRVVYNTIERNNISTIYRKQGMLVRTQTDNKLYELRGGVTNAHWVEVFLAPNPVNYKVMTQTVPSTIWDMTHDMGFYPNVTIMDGNGFKINTQVQFVSVNRVVLTFNTPEYGKVVFS